MSEGWSSMSNGEADIALRPNETELQLTREQIEAVREALTHLPQARAEAPPAPVAEPARLEEAVTARGPIVTVPPIFFATPITGIERTQATQFFNINGKGSGYAADNTVPLV